MLTRISAAVLLASLPMITVASSAYAGVTLTVDINNVIQDNFLGIGAVYHGFAYMPESIAKGYDDDIRKIEFDRVEGMRLPLARTWYRADWACGQVGYPGYDWESTKMKAFYQWLKEMKKRKVDVAINSAWWCTNDVYNDFPFTNADPNTWPIRVNQWAAWMSESLNQIIKVRDFTNVKYVMLFTEPDYESGKVPPGYTQYQAWKEAVTVLNQRLITDGIRGLVKLVGPNHCCWHEVATAVKELNDVIDIYTSHSYDEPDYDHWYAKTMDLKNQVTSSGKPFWMDEYGRENEAQRNTADYGNYIAQANAAFLNAGAQSTQIWLVFDQQYVWPRDTFTNENSFHDGVHQCGTQPFIPVSKIPRPSYYAFTIMSKYMGGPGTKVYSTQNEGGVYIAAAQLPSGDWSFLVVNGNQTSQDITVNIRGGISGKKLYRYLYDPANLMLDASASTIGYDKTFAKVTTNFGDVLPAKAVVIYSSIAGKK